MKSRRGNRHLQVFVVGFQLRLKRAFGGFDRLPSNGHIPDLVDLYSALRVDGFGHVDRIEGGRRDPNRDRVSRRKLIVGRDIGGDISEQETGRSDRRIEGVLLRNRIRRVAATRPRIRPRVIGIVGIVGIVVVRVILRVPGIGGLLIRFGRSSAVRLLLGFEVSLYLTLMELPTAIDPPLSPT